MGLSQRLTAAAISQFEGHKSGEYCSWIKLADYAFDVAQTSRNWMQRNNVAVTRRRQRDETQIKDRIGKARVILKCYSFKSLWDRQSNKGEQCSEGNCDE